MRWHSRTPALRWQESIAQWGKFLASGARLDDDNDVENEDGEPADIEVGESASSVRRDSHRTSTSEREGPRDGQ